MKTTVVCGLLGAGKTTFIRHFAASAGVKAVVLVNDFGKTGIDGEIFSADGMESIELPSGCICCTLKFDLITTIEKILKTHAPAHLLIEPSGVASPSGVLEALDALSIRPVTVVGIVDATEFIELHEARLYGRFFEDQIMTSDVILVNKSDLVSGEKIEKTAGLVEALNPGAVVFRTVNARLEYDLSSIPAPTHRPRRKAPEHLHFDTVSLKLRKGTEYAILRGFFDEMAKGEYGHVVRAKALVQTERGPFRFDLSYGKMDGAIFEKDVADGRLVIIGEGLKKDELARKVSMEGRAED